MLNFDCYMRICFQVNKFRTGIWFLAHILKVGIRYFIDLLLWFQSLNFGLLYWRFDQFGQVGIFEFGFNVFLDCMELYGFTC